MSVSIQRFKNRDQEPSFLSKPHKYIFTHEPSGNEVWSTRNYSAGSLGRRRQIGLITVFFLQKALPPGWDLNSLVASVGAGGELWKQKDETSLLLRDHAPALQAKGDAQSFSIFENCPLLASGYHFIGSHVNFLILNGDVQRKNCQPLSLGGKC